MCFSPRKAGDTISMEEDSVPVDMENIPFPHRGIWLDCGVREGLTSSQIHV